MTDKDRSGAGGSLEPARAESIDGPTEAGLPPPLEAVLHEVPDPARERIREQITTLMQVQGPMVSPLVSKLTPDHLDKLIDGSARDRELAYADKQDGRKYSTTLAIVFVIASLLLAGLMLWQGQPEMLRDAMQLGLGFAGGYGLGWGRQRRRGK